MMIITPLALLVVSTVSLDTVTALNNLRMTSRKPQTYAQYEDYCQEMLDAVNVERSKEGLAPLCSNNKLSAAAKRHSDDMAAQDFMAHVGSDGSTMSQRITASEYEWDAIAENVAAGQEDVTSVMVSWMNSKGHRANILGPDYTMLGMAYAYNGESKYKHYWTQDFGTGGTETCDSGNATDSPTTDLAQVQTQDDTSASAATSQEETSDTTTVATPAPSAPATTVDPSSTATETPAPIKKSRGCKAKK
uniref:SCP domain-containing protein n=1 Tax=Peronospora matthiolae TaxID=2874970 RepID=A0AAV1UVQ9_9STRA